MPLLKYLSRLVALLLVPVLLLVPAPARAQAALVATASNFAAVAARLAPVFHARTGLEVTVTTGSTGKLYAQIGNGAPYDILLAADQRRPRLLEASGLAVKGSRFTYATGCLTLWSADTGLIGGNGADVLRAGKFRFLAIANPDLAPYGIAAKQTLTRLGLWDALHGRIVMGQNIGQTFAMVATGNAELGFVANSYVIAVKNTRPGSKWNVPQNLYDPIRQDAVLLEHGRNSTAAKAFLAFLKSDEARSVILKSGYGTK